MTTRVLMPWTILAPMILLGVVLIDLTFDLDESGATQIAYYRRHRTATGVAAVAVPAVVVVGFIPLVVRLVRYMTTLDIASAVVAVPAAYMFAGMLVPMQEELIQPDIDTTRASELMDNIRVLHLIMLAALPVLVVLQVLAHRVDIGTLIKPKES